MEIQDRPEEDEVTLCWEFRNFDDCEAYNKCLQSKVASMPLITTKQKDKDTGIWSLYCHLWHPSKMVLNCFEGVAEEEVKQFNGKYYGRC